MIENSELRCYFFSQVVMLEEYGKKKEIALG